jgi:outer membrane lipoprotein carrier protein
MIKKRKGDAVMIRKLMITVMTGTIWAAAGDIAIPAAFRAHFVQTVTNPEKKVIRYEGEVLFSKPSRMKWVYEKPTRKEVCTDGKDILVVEHELEQVSRYRMRKPFDLEEILKRAEPISERIYTATYEGKVYTLRVDEKGRVDSIAFFDDTDNKVQLLFTRIRTKKKAFDASRMRCDYPAEYDVIEG